MEVLGEREADTAAGANVPGFGVSTLLRDRRLRSVPASGPGFRPLRQAHDGGAAADVQRCLELLESAASTAPDELAATAFPEAADFAAIAEELSRRVEYLQLLAAAAVDKTRTEAINAAGSTSRGTGWTTGWGTGNAAAAATAFSADDAAAATPTTAASFPAASATRSPADDGCRNSAEYLRARLRISVSEARRRLALAASVLPRISLPGHTAPANHEEVAAALATATISSSAGTVITTALERVRHIPDSDTFARMEHSLTRTAIENDQDFLTRIARRWVEAVEQDGSEPSEEELRHRQGAFLRRPRRGLHHIEIFATPEQCEHLLTAMNVATNPRTHAGTLPGSGRTGDGQDNDDTKADELDRRTRPQRLLDGLVGACKTALATGVLPATGGLRPQVMVIIDYQYLLNRLETSAAQDTSRPGSSQPAPRTANGTFVHTGPVTPATIRKIACDADIIPVLLGSNGRILDIGRTTRIFPPHIRKALSARDQGCAFPNCTIPATWCEAHHITYWSRGGPTSTDNGVLLCTHHHHLVHKEQWKIHVTSGIPWFIPPPHIDPGQKPRQNHHHRT
jgi:hypothetical protein